MRGEFAKCFSSLILNVSSLTISLRDSGSIQNALRPTLYLLRSSTRPPRLSLFTASSPDHLFKLSSPLHPILSKKGCNPPHTTTHTPISLYTLQPLTIHSPTTPKILIKILSPRLLPIPTRPIHIPTLNHLDSSIKTTRTHHKRSTDRIVPLLEDNLSNSLMINQEQERIGNCTSSTVKRRRGSIRSYRKEKRRKYRWSMKRMGIMSLESW